MLISDNGIYWEVLLLGKSGKASRVHVLGVGKMDRAEKFGRTIENPFLMQNTKLYQVGFFGSNKDDNSGQFKKEKVSHQENARVSPESKC